MKIQKEDGTFIYKCECGKEFDNPKKFNGHCNGCKQHLKNKKDNKKEYLFDNITNKWKCRFCKKESDNIKSICQHEIRCKENINRIINKGNTISHTARNKGLTKETDIHVAKMAKSLHDNYIKGLNNIGSKGDNNPAKRPKIRAKISAKSIENHLNGIGHTWKHRKDEPSYPEKMIINILKDEFGLIEGIDYVREEPYYGMFLDFLFPKQKKVIEVDGEQHYTDEKQKEIDLRKDTKLKEEGFQELRIRWSEYLKNKTFWINEINKFLMKENYISSPYITRKEKLNK